MRVENCKFTNITGSTSMVEVASLPTVVISGCRLQGYGSTMIKMEATEARATDVEEGARVSDSGASEAS